LPLIGCVSSSIQAQEKKDNKVYEIKIAHTIVSTDPIGQGWEKFKQVIEQKSSGRIKVTIFPNKQLVNSDREVAEQVQYNVNQMGSVPTFTLASVADIKEYMLCDYPYLFSNDAEIYKVLDGPIGKELAEKLEQKIGVKAFGSYSLGWVKLGNTKRQGMGWRTYTHGLW
jgi:C4-dicarboxylate-binding protein DctP